MNPHFGGATRVQVAVTSVIGRPDDSPLDGAYYAWADPSDDDSESGCYPFVFDCPEATAYGHLALPTSTAVQIAAFAHSIEVWDSVESYNAAGGDSSKLASKSFIPSGLFTPDGESAGPPESEAILTGTVAHPSR